MKMKMNINADKPLAVSFPPLSINTLFNKDMNYYVCSAGGCGSTVLSDYLSRFGNVKHIHDRSPPRRLCYVGSQHAPPGEEVYSEWFNKIEIPEDKLGSYKVLFLYRNPISVIFTRFAQAAGPNVPHLQHIQCPKNGQIWLGDVLRSGNDLYKLEEFFDNYTLPRGRNYPIYCIKYEQLFENWTMFNQVLGLPDIPSLYPKKVERPRTYQYVKELSTIYRPLIQKMNARPFISMVEDTVDV